MDTSDKVTAEKSDKPASVTMAASIPLVPLADAIASPPILAEAAQTRPIDLAIPRVDRSGFDGPALRRSLYVSFSALQILDAVSTRTALDAGARGFVLKEAPVGDLARAVTLVADGGTYVDPVLAGYLAQSHAADRLPSLTQREREVLRLLADGNSNEEIGKRLFISPETVRTHVRKAMDKLESDTRTQAVATALRQSLIA